MDISALLLARIQFVASLSFFVVFLSLSLSLAWFLLAFRLRAAGGSRPEWMAAYRFWIRIFSLALVLALASAVPVIFLLGMLWPTLLARIGNVLGPMLACAGVTLFIFKFCFLRTMLFGQGRVSSRLHVLSVAMVAIGLTGFVGWLIAIESWTHVPQGVTWFDGQYRVQDWRAIILNAAMPWHFLLFVMSSLLAGAFLVMGVTAWQALRRTLNAAELAAFSAGRIVAWVVFMLLLPAGAGTLIMVCAHQPMLAATLAGHWHTGDPLSLLPWIRPAGLSAGLDQYAGMHPPVAPVLWLARGGVILGLLMLAATLLRGRWRWRVLSALSFAGVLALLAGWLMLELGRQPYAVAGTVTWRESLGTALHPAWLALGAGAQLLLEVALLCAFVRRVFRGTRYGVAPVRKETV